MEEQIYQAKNQQDQEVSRQSALTNEAPSVAPPPFQLNASPIQTKLSVGAPDDLFEKEADEVAEQVMASMGTPAIQPKNDETKIQTKPVFQLKAGNTGGAGQTEVSDEVQQGIHSARGQGSTLPGGLRDQMESAFGADFGNVKIHQNEQADTLNRSLNARAFTTGQDIFFKQGEYNPNSSDGQKLLAHELTHVVQQGSGGALIQRENETRPAQAQAHTLTIGSQTYHNISTEEALVHLNALYRSINMWRESGMERHEYMIRLRREQWIVGSISDTLGGVTLPDISIWMPVRILLDGARGTLDGQFVEPSFRNLQRANNAYRTAQDQVSHYIDGTTTGAERGVTVLHYTAVAGAVAATVATGGMATAAGVTSIAGTSLVAAGTAGTYSLIQNTAGQASEVHYGLRREIDVREILRRGATDAITAFVGGIVGGHLTNMFKRMMGPYLSNIGDDVLRELGEHLNLGGPLPRDYFLTNSQRYIAEFLANAAATPITVAVTHVVNRLTGEATGPLPTPEQLLRQIWEETRDGGIMNLFITFLTHHSNMGNSPVLRAMQRRAATRATSQASSASTPAAHTPAHAATEARPSVRAAETTPPAHATGADTHTTQTHQAPTDAIPGETTQVNGRAPEEPTRHGGDSEVTEEIDVSGFDEEPTQVTERPTAPDTEVTEEIDVSGFDEEPTQVTERPTAPDTEITEEIDVSGFEDEPTQVIQSPTEATSATPPPLPVKMTPDSALAQIGPFPPDCTSEGQRVAYIANELHFVLGTTPGNHVTQSPMMTALIEHMAISNHVPTRNSAHFLADSGVPVLTFEQVIHPYERQILRGIGNPSNKRVILLPDGRTSIIFANANGYHFPAGNGREYILLNHTNAMDQNQMTLRHEVSHALNPLPYELSAYHAYIHEFQAFWVGEYAHVADPAQRAADIRNNILGAYPDIIKAYNNDSNFRSFVDNMTRPYQGNDLNSQNFSRMQSLLSGSPADWPRINELWQQMTPQERTTVNQSELMRNLLAQREQESGGGPATHQEPESGPSRSFLIQGAAAGTILFMAITALLNEMLDQ